MNNHEMIQKHREQFPDCPATRNTCKHWGRFNYVARFNGCDPVIGTIEAFDIQTAHAVAQTNLARDFPFELLELAISK